MRCKKVEQRRICADLGNAPNCSYAKVKTEKGEYPVVTFTAGTKEGTLELDSKTIRDVKFRVETTCWNVYCTHPEAKRKYVGTVEPYFSCLAPADCPKICKERAEKIAREKSAIVGTGRESLWEKIQKFFAK